MSFNITGDVVTEPIALSDVVSFEYQFLAVYDDQRDNWWTAADTREKALAAFERVRSQVSKKPLYRVFARWDTAKLKQMADFMALETPSTAIH
ncbi:hypothetical protein ACRQ5Q_14850 [Bradyrhizobium sp. PMVTL-01]|uniref:hypothetical protein n=1 Tax=Bradyrhizobium sp. PMVTL-01 TaxID=3434999 RepID=UPI003F703B37